VTNQKKVFAGLVLASLFTGFLGWQASARIRGQIVARLDLERGHYIVLALGLPAAWRSNAAQLLRERYGIEMRVVAGCVVTEPLLAYVDGYNEVSTKAANQKFGHDVFQESMAEAARNRRIR
jgi:hypothetical protein